MKSNVDRHVQHECGAYDYSSFKKSGTDNQSIQMEPWNYLVFLMLIHFYWDVRIKINFKYTNDWFSFSKKKHRHKTEFRNFFNKFPEHLAEWVFPNREVCFCTFLSIL